MASLGEEILYTHPYGLGSEHRGRPQDTPFQDVIPLRINRQPSTNGNKVAVGHVRVGTLEQVSEGVSLEAQPDTLKACCKRNGIKLIDIKADEGSFGGTLECQTACVAGDASSER